MKFSVTIPAYKQKYLHEAIESVINQTFSDFELIIVDDCSPEDLISIVKSFSDPRIHYYRNEKNCGSIDVVDNWNICLSLCKGDYMICMGDDDKLLNNCLEEYNKLITKYPNIGVLHGWTEIIDEKSKIKKLLTHRCEYESALSLLWHRWNRYELQFIGDFCFKTEILRAKGGFFKLPLAWASDDISAIICASINGIANSQTPVFQYRINSLTISNTGSPTIKMIAIEKEKQWIENFLCDTPNDTWDYLYWQDLRNSFFSHYDKKKSGTIAKDLRQHSFFRCIWWLIHKSEYHISTTIILKALKMAIR